MGEIHPALENGLQAILKRVSGRKVFVTGADGFIGSHLVELLVRNGANVTALILYNSFNSWGWLDDVSSDVRGQFQVVAGDIRDGDFLKAAMQGNEMALHLAALISIPYSYLSPASYVETNIVGTLNVLQAARHCDLSRVVCTSTSEVYGTARYVPIDENHPLQGQSPYAASKIGADQMALAFHRTYETPVVLLRPFNTFGPRQSARAVIPTIVGQIASGMNEIELGSLHPTRDFSFVTDTARAFVHAAVVDGGVGQAINTGSGFEISIGEVAALIGEMMNKSVKIRQSEQRIRPDASEVDRLYAGIERAARDLDWTPEYGGREGFKRGLESTIAWFCDPSNLNRYKTAEYNV